VVTAYARVKIGQLFFVIFEGMGSRVILDAKVRRFFRHMIDADFRLEPQQSCSGGELDERQAISKRVVDPSYFSRLG